MGKSSKNRKKANKNIKNTLGQNILWYIAIILEWIIIPLYIASMGYEFDIDIYQTLKNWDYVTIVYYIVATIDIALFAYFMMLYRKREQLQLAFTSVFCCLTQIILLISKVKW